RSSPANLLLDRQGTLWVTDFGLALLQDQPGLTLTGELLGTLRYMSPEQAGTLPGIVDQRADIYSLGATLYEFLTLEPLFDAGERHVPLHQIAADEPRSLRALRRDIPLELETTNPKS